MASINDRIIQHYHIHREVSQTADLAALLLGRLLYEPPHRTPVVVSELVKRLHSGQLEGLSGNRAADFGQWLTGYLVINKTVKGTSFYPLHPILTLSSNGEGSRIDRFISALAHCFTSAEREHLQQVLWSTDRLPPFERAVNELIAYQLPSDYMTTPATVDLFTGSDERAEPFSPEGILARTKEDILALAEGTIGIQAFVTHASRLLAFALPRYLLARADIDLSLPIYAAPAADTHEGVRTLAHEIIEIHRARYAEALKDLFFKAIHQASETYGVQGNPSDEAAAQRLAKEIFAANANIVPQNQYLELLQEYESFAGIAYHYYWSHGGASNRFLRQVHSAHLNLAKKAGFANSRSQHSRWHFYWLAPALVETLLIVTRQRLQRDRMLVVKLLEEWRNRYGIAVLIDASWDDVYRHSFRALGSPEALNEANQRRFMEILAERGRLHKNSDDFPWVVLKD